MRGALRGNVLLVGPSTANQEMLAHVAKQYGISARPFAAWEQCSHALRRGACCLLVVDLDGKSTNICDVVAEARQIRAWVPILVLVAPGDISAAVRAMKAGATDCLEKSTPVMELRSVLGGLLSRGASLRPKVGAVLTRTECVVLARILEGKTNREVADLLHRSPRTVEVHRRKIMRKVGAANVAGLVRQAAALRLLDRRGQTPDSEPGIGRGSPANQGGRPPLPASLPVR